MRAPVLAETAAHPVVSRDEWLAARRDLLVKEKEFTRLRDRLSEQRRSLPWVRIEKEYVFDSPSGPVTLGDLFRGRSQLIVQHVMLPPGGRPCIGCSFGIDHVDGILVHLEHHDVSYAAVARAPIGEIEAVRQRMGWRIPWVSSHRSDFNYDFQVSFTPEQLAAGKAVYNFREIDPGIADLPGKSVFFRDEAGQIFHTYSTFSRGGEDFLTAYRVLDITPKGRNENGPHFALSDWVKLRTDYDEPQPRKAHTACGCEH